MEFEWDPSKEARNLEKHAISFVAAAQVLASGNAIEFPSDHRSEPRWIAVGEHHATRRIVAIVYTMREGRYRIISARRARKDEEEKYRKRVEAQASERDRGGKDRPDDQR